MSKNNSAAESLRAMTAEQLSEALKETYKELFTLRIKLSTGQLLTNHQIRLLRKKIARILTIMTQKKTVGDV